MICTTDQLTVKEAAEQRRSVRAYAPEPVAPEDLDEILRLTGLAPSAFNLQPWRFVVVRTPEVKARLAAAAFQQRQVHGAPAVIVLYTDMAEALERVDEALHPGMDAAQRASALGGILKTFARMSAAEREQWGAEQGNIALNLPTASVNPPRPSPPPPPETSPPRSWNSALFSAIPASTSACAPRTPPSPRISDHEIPGVITYAQLASYPGISTLLTTTRPFIGIATKPRFALVSRRRAWPRRGGPVAGAWTAAGTRRTSAR